MVLKSNVFWVAVVEKSLVVAPGNEDAVVPKLNIQRNFENKLSKPGLNV